MTIAPGPIRWDQGPLGPWWLVPQLWSTDEHERTRAATVLAEATGDETSPWDNEQRWMIRSLSCWVGRRADEFLEAYQALEAGLDDLPVEGSRLWLAAASIWFHRENWKRLLVDELPSSVADLADPAVRLIIGFAYARSAISNYADGDIHSSLQKVQQARATLAELVEDWHPTGRGFPGQHRRHKRTRARKRTLTCSWMTRA